MSLDELIRLQAGALDAILSMAMMRPHVEPLPTGWRVIATTRSDAPPITVETTRTDLVGLVDALQQTHARWSLAMRRVE